MSDAAETATIDRRTTSTTRLISSSADPTISYRPARRADVATLAPRLRTPDLTEIHDGTGWDAETALTVSFENSTSCWSVLTQDRAIAMFGVARIPERPEFGLAWMLSSDEALKHPRAFLRDGPAWVRELMKSYRAIGNFIGADNEAYIRWLKRLGFRFVRKHEQFGLAQKPFWEFAIAASELDAVSAGSVVRADLHAGTRKA